MYWRSITDCDSPASTIAFCDSSILGTKWHEQHQEMRHEIWPSFVAEFRGKELVMRLMMHPEPEVQKQALLCVQKIMLAKDKLEYLNTN